MGLTRRIVRPIRTAGRPLARGGSVISPPARADRFLFGATRLELPHKTGTASSTREAMISRIFFGTPDYATREWWLFYPNFYLDELGGVPCENDMTAPASVYGSVEISGVFHQVSFNGQAQGQLLPGTCGLWGKVASTFQPAASSAVRARTWHVAANTGDLRPVGYARMSSLGEAAQWASTPDLALLSSGTITNTASGQYYGPSHAVCKGNDGRKVVMLFDNSIGNGEDETGGLADGRGNIGFMKRGLDENSVSRRLPYGNMNMLGTRLSGRDTLSAGEFRRCDQIIMTAPGGPNVMPFDGVIFGDENDADADGPTWVAKIQRAVDFVKSRYGVKSIVRSLDPKTTIANNQPWTTLNDQTAAADARLAANAALGNMRGVPVVIRSAEAVQDVGTPSKWAVPAFSTTLAAQADPGNGTISLTAAPSVGALLALGAGSSGYELTTVQSVSGSGPYTVTIIPTIVSTRANGAAVQEVSTDDGVHRSTRLHIRDGAAIVAPAKASIEAAL